MNSLIRFFLENKLIAFLLILALIVGGIRVAPFDWQTELLARDPIAVDAIPDIGENQQVVFTTWAGRSPRDVEDQITYPLTVSLLGLPGVKTIRSFSYFGYSSIYILFNEEVEYYWSRSRVLEKLSALPPSLLPDGVLPALGPDATALGQVFWYTIEGRDRQGRPTGGWDPQEIRTVQDWYVRYALQGASGVAEVASVGGYVREYQIDIDPAALRAFDVTIPQVIDAVRESNLDVGARTIEVNRVEYVVRGIGFIQSIEDLEQATVAVGPGNVPIRLKELGTVGLGPALRRGALDKNGAEVVGGVVVARFGENPLAAIHNVKEKIAEIAAGMPEKTLPDGTISKLTIVPFYDRTGLIYETLNTLEEALTQEVLITILVVAGLLLHAASSLLISLLLPLGILFAFILMKVFEVDANIVALSGIAIAIGTMVDIGIVLCENIYSRLASPPPGETRLQSIYQASIEVSGAVLTATLTTVVSFLPVFALEAAEGKLFRPLAYTKTFSLIGALVVALLIIPPAAHLLFKKPKISSSPSRLQRFTALGRLTLPGLLGLVALYLLSISWRPLGVSSGLVLNFLMAALVVAATLVSVRLFEKYYTSILGWFLRYKAAFALFPLTVLLLGALSWSRMGEEFMPPLDEGSFLYMPTTMPHASIGESLDILQKLDRAIAGIPEVESVVGKLGRAESALDPAPVSMFENIVNYKSEFAVNDHGELLYFAYDDKRGEFLRDDQGQLIPDEDGEAFRQWRPHIRSVDDIWSEIQKAAVVPGATSAPKLQPIQARLVMLQSGMRAPMGVKIKGPSLEEIDAAGKQIERFLREVELINPATVVADRVVAKPYLEIEVNRSQIARYGLSVEDVQRVIEVAVGGMPLTTTVEGRERYPVRIRYQRELRDDPESLAEILIPTPSGAQIPLKELAEIRFERRAQMIKSEDTFLTSYVVFDKASDAAEVEVVEAAKRHLANKIDSGELKLPAGVSYSFAGTYENQLRAKKRLLLIVPFTLLLTFLLLYLQFRSTVLTMLVFSGIFVAWSGGFILLALYAQPWFLDFSVFGLDLRETLNVRTFNLSTAVWVGFIALFGIATDDGVLMATYLRQAFRTERPEGVDAIRKAVLEGAARRIRPAMMTTATTLLALLPVMTSRGRGSDILVPMALPVFGGMLIAILTVFVVPVCYSALAERRLITD